MEEADTRVRGEGVDMAEGGVFDARRRMAIAQTFARIRSARVHPLEPGHGETAEFVVG